MNAHRTIASLFALARACGKASAEYAPGTADHEVSETAAVMCAKLGLELEHAYHLEPPPQAELCPLCKGSRVTDVPRDMPCNICFGVGFMRAAALALVVLALLLVGCGGAEFFPADPFARAVDGSGIDPVAEGAALEPGADASAGEFRDADLAPEAQANDAPAALGMQDPNDGSAMRTDPSDAAGPSLREAGTSPETGPPVCIVNACPACAPLEYACCIDSTRCGCESPAQGGQCR